MKKVIISTKGLCKSFSNEGIQQHVLKNLDIDIYEGDFTIIMGSSGSGKSTLLYSLSGMDKPTLGDIYFKDKIISNLTNDELAIFRRINCGFVFQQNYLLDTMSVLDNVIVSGALLNRNRKEVADKAKKLLNKVQIGENIFGKFPTQISGGEAQRVGVTRALINDPTLIFADEPTGALNSATGKSVLDVFSDINSKGQSILLVTHDINTALRGNRIIFIGDGIIQGSLELSKYDEEDNENRSKKLHTFLSEMRW